MNHETQLVVIGSVKSDQYKDVRWRLVREGVKPRIVRVPLEAVQRDIHEVARAHGISAYEVRCWSSNHEDPCGVDPYDLLRKDIESEFGIVENPTVVLIGEDEAYSLDDIDDLERIFGVEVLVLNENGGVLEEV